MEGEKEYTVTSLELIELCSKCYELGLRDASSQMGVPYVFNFEQFEAKIHVALDGIESNQC